MSEKLSNTNDDLLMDELLANPFDLNKVATNTIAPTTSEPLPTKLIDRLVRIRTTKSTPIG